MIMKEITKPFIYAKRFEYEFIKNTREERNT